MGKDRFLGITSTTGPISYGFAVSPSDGTDLEEVTRSLMVATTGDVRVTLMDQAEGDSLTLPALQPGALYPFRVKRIWASGSSAGGIIGLV
ncbi:hypothetical protein J7413_01100 [Shimia sp. R10_1]|uniref:spike base protein, RCAP_Rcc01079 family n=1 Tax=Shimia sp. R10_1 TaxID=2821095 RepID=UPI001ADAA885|nr:hypothetical protein [Shimia sp. R10_1]MBO9472124.1 hypothetical protein [Shimia sp. R10_1]